MASRARACDLLADVVKMWNELVLTLAGFASSLQARAPPNPSTSQSRRSAMHRTGPNQRFGLGDGPR